MTRQFRGTPFVAALLALALAAWVFGAAAAWRSYIGMVPATGAVATLADAILRGQAPGHDDGSVLLATFYLPPYPMLVAGARSIGFGWPGALRAGSLFTGLLLMLAAAWLARTLGAGRRGALLAPALVAASYTFMASSLGGRADLLAAAFAIAALAAWSRDEEARGWRLPALAAAAFLVKATSLAVPLALVFWSLAHRRPRAIVRFGIRFAACAVAESLLTLPAHGPTWYADALRALVTATPGTSEWLRGPTELVRYLGTLGELALYATFALTLLASRPMRGRPVVAYFSAALLIAMIVMTNFGAGPNHLDELFAVVATLSAVWAERRLTRPALLPAFALAIAVLGASWRDLLGPVRQSAAPDYMRSSVIAAVRSEPGEVLTEDALISLAAGRRPFVSDPGALRSLSLKGDPRAVRIVDGIRRGRFALIVLDNDLDSDARWYHNVHLGDLVTAAIRAHYRPVGTVNGRFLWRPRGA